MLLINNRYNLESFFKKIKKGTSKKIIMYKNIILYTKKVLVQILFENMPQLDIFAFSSIAVFSSITIVCMIFIMHTYIIPKISEVVKLRHKLNQSSNKKVTINSEKNYKDWTDEISTVMVLETTKRLDLVYKMFPNLKINKK